MRKILTSLFLSAAVCSNAAVVLSESFDNFTAGTDMAYDVTPVANLDELMSNPGWTLTGSAHQAGGSIYLPVGSVLTTPAIDLSAGGVNYSITFKVKSSAQGLHFIMDTNYGMQFGDVSDQWAEITLPMTSGGPATAISFCAQYNDLYLDDIRISDGGLDAPVTLKATDFSTDGFTANWKPVTGAESYLLSVYTLKYDYDTKTFNKDYIISDKEVAATSYRVTEGDFDVAYYYAVKAKAGTLVTEASAEQEANPEYVEAPVASAASGITSEGFTASWTSSPLATLYYLHVLRTHQAMADETYALISTDFSDLSADGTIDKPQKELTWTLDGDWIVNMANLTKGYLGLNNQDIDLFGQAYLQSPVFNLAGSDNCVTISFDAMSRGGMKNGTVAIGSLVPNVGIVTDESKDFTLTEELQHYNFTLTGSTVNCALHITSTEAGQMYITNLKVTADLQAGSSIVLPVRTYTTTETSQAVSDLKSASSDSFGYYVVGSWAVRKQEGVVRIRPEVLSDNSNLVTVSLPAGVEDIKSDAAAVDTGAGCITFANPAGAPVNVYTADGRAISATTAREGSISVAPGIYIVTIGSAAHKVAVK